jgi:hypothetical protein
MPHPSLRNTSFLEWRCERGLPSFRAMTSGASTPEELEALLEDAFVTRDAGAVAELFEQEAVLAADDGQPPARGSGQIARLVSAIWQANRTFVAQPKRILQASGTALVVADASINVARRGGDGAWRYAISLLSLEHARKEMQ